VWEAPPPRDQRPNAAFEFELEFEFDPLLGQWCGAVPFGVVAVDVVVVWAAWDREPPAAANATLPPAAAVQTAGQREDPCEFVDSASFRRCAHGSDRS